jgi:hypothetical protein
VQTINTSQTAQVSNPLRIPLHTGLAARLLVKKLMSPSGALSRVIWVPPASIEFDKAV